MTHQAQITNDSNALPQEYYFHVYMYLTYGVPDNEVDMKEIIGLSNDCFGDGHYALAAEMFCYAIDVED